MLAQVDG